MQSLKAINANNESAANLGAAGASASNLLDSNAPRQVNSLGLTPEEETKCRKAFKAFDKDGNEELDIDELRIVLKMMGISVTEAKLQRMMTEASPDDSTQITID